MCKSACNSCPREHQPTCLVRRASADHVIEPREALRQLSVRCLRLLHGLGCLDSLRPQPPHLVVTSRLIFARCTVEGKKSAHGNPPRSWSTQHGPQQPAANRQTRNKPSCPTKPWPDTMVHSSLAAATNRRKQRFPTQAMACFAWPRAHAAPSASAAAARAFASAQRSVRSAAPRQSSTCAAP